MHSGTIESSFFNLRQRNIPEKKKQETRLNPHGKLNASQLWLLAGQKVEQNKQQSINYSYLCSKWAFVQLTSIRSLKPLWFYCCGHTHTKSISLHFLQLKITIFDLFKGAHSKIHTAECEIVDCRIKSRYLSNRNEIHRNQTENGPKTIIQSAKTEFYQYPHGNKRTCLSYFSHKLFNLKKNENQIG